MSASERFATIPFMIALSRAGFLPPSALKSPSCFRRYSGNWPASLGFAAATLLPSAAWQAAHTWLAMACALPASGFAGPCAWPAAAHAASAAASANLGVILLRPERKGPILLEFSAFDSHAFFLRRAVHGGDRRARATAAGRRARDRVRRALQRGQVERDQRARRTQAPCAHEQDPRAHADHQFLCARRKRAPRRSAGIRLRARPAGAARALGSARGGLPALSRRACRRRPGDGRAPSAHAAR